MRRSGLAGMFVLVACGDDSSGGDIVTDTEYIGEDLPAGNCGDTDEESCTSSGGDAMPSGCQASSECPDGESCTAMFNGDIGAFACRSSCIDDMDETRWCIDDAGCCGADSVCQERGYCVPAGRTSVDETGTADGGSDGSSESRGESTGALGSSPW